MRRLEFDTPEDHKQYLLKQTIRVNDCLIWIGTPHSTGYGTYRLHGKNYLVHRTLWTYEHGLIPKGKHILHKCDNRRCVKINHLFIGTNQDNVYDAMVKGRRDHRGENQNNAVLNENDVMVIWMVYHAYDTPPRGLQNRLAEEFMVTHGTINAIVRRKSWTHITDRLSYLKM